LLNWNKQQEIRAYSKIPIRKAC